MSFADDFSAGWEDMGASFGESVSWVSPAGVSTAVVSVVRRWQEEGDEKGTAMDRVGRVMLEVEEGALPAGVNGGAGWNVVVDGTTYQVLRCGLTDGGTWRVEARMRANASLGLGRRT